ncbi:patatin-like phospholipase family protein [Thermostaphylospora chromogena]|uniref:NTE family protein n=1 Tax=Thermostaphylospora chromogena TaxID=35622 RepID=A0A1H1FYR9_9ACTN|nr:patatin-like phospholipase family protein [Thermostaphylospora chromogena]SDR06050.1 NTE family protein [Thermostaphylospora chromogena]
MTKALILGGGGVAGVAWEAGVVTGLARGGVDLRDADLIVGTSAGSVVGTLIAADADLERFVVHQAAVDPALDSMTVPAPGADPMAAFAILADQTLDPAEARRRVGAMAMAAPVAANGERLIALGEQLPVKKWPDRRLLITAVEVESGARKVWERDSDVPLASAVASSCTVPCIFPPVRIGDHHYMDGGVYSDTNADLAAGASAAVVLDPMGYVLPRESLRRELDALGTDNHTVVTPDAAAAKVFGENVLDPALWRPAFDAGLAQAQQVRDAVAEVWHGRRDAR